MVTDYLSGNWQKACASQLYAMPLIDALFTEVNPIPIKYAMNKIGFDCGIPRLPLVELTKENKKKLDTALSNFEL